MSGQIITAIDAGSSKICTVICVVDDVNDELKVIGTFTGESKGIKKGVIVNIHEAVTGIQESLAFAEKMGGVSINHAYVTIDGKNIISDNKRGVVAITGEEIEMEDVYRAIESAKSTAIPHQIRKIIHVLNREYIVDTQSGIHEPLGMTGSRLEVDAHIISALSTTVHNLEKVFSDIGISVTPIFSGLASSQSVLTRTEKELGVMVLDIGHGTTDISIYQEDALCFSGCVILGGNSITSDLAVGLQIQSEQAEKLKTQISRFMDVKAKKVVENSSIPSFLRSDNNQNEGSSGINGSGGLISEDNIDISALGIDNLKILSKKMYEEIVGCRLDEIFQLVIDEVAPSGFSIKQPAGIVLTGGTANLYGIDKYCSRFFGVPCRIGTPHGLGGMIDEITGPDFAAVQGLILHAREKQLRGENPYDSEENERGSGVFGWISKLFGNFTP